MIETKTIFALLGLTENGDKVEQICAEKRHEQEILECVKTGSPKSAQDIAIALGVDHIHVRATCNKYIKTGAIAKSPGMVMSMDGRMVKGTVFHAADNMRNS